MRLFTRTLLLCLGASILFSCSDDKEIKNLAPTSPTIYFPLDAAKDIKNDVTLKWKESTDPEKESVKYDVYISKTEDFTDADIKSKDQTGLELKLLLEGHSTYFWKVIAKDNIGAITESKIFSFTTINAAPTVVGKLSPENEVSDIDKKVVFKWDKATDIDNDLVKYFLYVSTKKEFNADDIKARDLEDNTFELTLAGHTHYFWQVVSKDSEGGRSESDIYSFTTLNTAPSKAILTTPKNNIVNIEPSVDFTWDASIDEEKDAIKYTLFISENEDFSNIAFKKENIERLIYKNLILKFNTKYYWKVVSTDAFDAETESDVFTLTVKENDFSRDGHIDVIPVIKNNITTILKWKPSRGTTVKYTVYFGTNEILDENNIVLNNSDKTEYHIPNLDANTKYYWKITASGDANVEGDINSFSTTNYGLFTDARDNSSYRTIKIGEKFWMADNFAYIPYIISDDNDAKKCSVYGSNIDKDPSIVDLKENSNYTKYGVMYSWYMLEDIVPDGWHVATDVEWKAVELLNGITEADLDAIKKYRGEIAEKFKSSEEWNPAGTNTIGLNFLPAGRWALGDRNINESIYLWTGTETISESNSSLSSWYRLINKDNKGVYRNKIFKSQRYYVRLVKD